MLYEVITDGTELFYLSEHGRQTLLSVPVSTNDAFEFGAPTPLFTFERGRNNFV